MKTTVVLIFLALAVPVCAQNPIVQLNESRESSRSAFERRDSLFREIDLEKAETGFLLEYSLFAEDPLKHTGADGESVLNTDRWRMLYGGLQRAVVNSRAVKLPGLKELNSEFKEVSKEDKIILPLLWFEYNCFNEEAVSVSSKGIKKLGNGDTGIFKSGELFAVTPSVKKVKGRDFTFLLSPDFIFTNKETRPERLIVDFDDGKGNIEIKAGETIHVNYSSAGVKTINVYYDTPEENRLMCTSTLDVEIEEVIINKSTSVPDITGQKTGRAYLGASSTIEYYIYLGSGNTILDKPFFVLEGFDPYNTFSYQNLYDKISYAGLRDNLFNEGYDLILVNYVNGTDYIQRNAYALEELIKYVNSVKKVNCMTKYENVIMGFSMGGLVARYALKDMENRAEDHDTRLYISYDSPHRGANVPIGYQWLIKQMYDFEYLGWEIGHVIPQIADAYAIMNSPAARQMLILHALNLSGNTFINELTQMGMPQQCRNIALGNGSMQGVNYPGFVPGEKLLDLHFEIDILGDLWHLILDANCYALADNPPSPERVCEWYYKIITWQSSVLSVASLPYDNAPGGIYDLESFGIDLDIDTTVMKLTSTGFCFVPSVSAFDIPINAASLQAPITSQSPTSFNAIFINNYSGNELHIDMTLPKVNWILQQVNIGDVMDCDGSCLSISGPYLVCSPQTFTLSSVPGATVTWSTTPGNLFSPSSGTGTTAIIGPAFAAARGTGTLTFTVTRGSCSFNITKEILVGGDEPIIYGIPPDPSTPLCAGTINGAFASPSADGYYHWVVYGGTIVTGQGTASLSYAIDQLIPPETSGSVGISLTVHGACGNPLTKGVSVLVSSCGGGGVITKVYPNPAPDILTIEIDNRALDQTGIFDIRLYDSQGRVLRQARVKEGKVQFNVAGLKDGIYYLHIYDDRSDKPEVRQIVVQH